VSQTPFGLDYPAAPLQQAPQMAEPRPAMSHQHANTSRPEPRAMSHQHVNTSRPEPRAMSHQHVNTSRPEPRAMSHQHVSTSRTEPRQESYPYPSPGYPPQPRSSNTLNPKTSSSTRDDLVDRINSLHVPSHPVHQSPAIVESAQRDREGTSGRPKMESQ
jgi:hypothetical protein